jgi:polar amino acid transport system substrate-binding protein
VHKGFAACWVFLGVAFSRSVFALIAITLLSLATVSLAQAASSDKPLRWAADAEGGAPYISMDPEHPGKYIGFEVDLTQALEKEIGQPIVFQQANFTTIASALNRGDFDFAMNGLERTPDREELFRLSRPYYVFTLQLVVRRDESRINSLDDCKKPGIRVGTLGDTAASRLLTQMKIPYRTYDNQTSPYKDLEQNQLDAVLLDLPIAMQYTKRDPDFNNKLKFAGKPISPGFYVILFKKENEELAKRFDTAIDHLLANGTLRKIYEAWDLWNDDQVALQTGNLAPEKAEEVLHTSATKWTFSQYFPRLLEGAAMTVALTVLGFMLAMAIGLPVATARLYGPAPLRTAATVYVEFFRGIPVLLLLYFLYYSLPEVGEWLHLGASALKLHPFVVGIIGFGLNYGAYESEIYRAGISSIPIGQWEAGASLGMSPQRIFRRIILPQAIKIILPPMTNDFVALFKDTSVVSVIAVEELMKRYQIMAADHLQYVEIGITTIALYLMMSVPLAQLSGYLERKWGKS